MSIPLILPLALWNGTPSHSITTIAASPDKSIIATGSSDGKLFLWSTRYNEALKREKVARAEKPGYRPNEEQNISLKCVCVGHRAPITSLLCAVYSEGKPALVSVSGDGTLCIWSFDDGRCLASQENMLKSSATCATLLPSLKHIACAGHSSFIEVVNLSKMRVVLRLLAHQNWVTSLFACDLKSNQVSSPILVSGSADGVIQFWSLKKGERELPLQTVCLEISPPIAIVLSPNYVSMVIVTSEEWMLYTTKPPQEVLCVPAPEGSSWKGANFVSHNTLIVWTTEGTGYLYMMPRLASSSLSFSVTAATNLIQPKKDKETFGSSLSSSMELDGEDVQVDAAKPPQNFRVGLLSKLNIIDKSKSDILQPICTFSTQARDTMIRQPTSATYTSGSWNRLFVTGDQQGRLNMWIVPSRPLALDFPRVLPWAEADPAQWNNVHSLKEDERRQVTAVHIIEEQMLLVLGYQDGTIRICNIPTNKSPAYYHQAHTGAVTSMLSSINDRRIILVTGGEDTTVQAWIIKDNQVKLLWKFVEHTGPIIRLVRPPVSLLSPVHPAFVQSIYWQVTQGYLLVECEDGSVTIWEMDTGQMEGCVYGETARNIIQSSTNMLPETVGEFPKVEEKCVTPYNIQHLQDTMPITLLFINIKQLLVDLSQPRSRRPSRSLSMSYQQDILQSLSSQAKPQHAIPAAPLSTYANGTPEVPPAGKEEEATSSPAMHPAAKIFSKSAPSDSPTVPVKEDSGETHEDPRLSTSYQLLSYLLPWYIKEDMDERYCKEFLLYPPNPSFTYALKGNGGNITVLVPPSSPKELAYLRFQCSDYLTAIHSLSSLSVLQQLINEPHFAVHPGLQNMCAHLTTWYSTLAGDKLERYCTPSLQQLSMYWQDAADDVKQAARAAFNGAAANMSTDARKSFATHLSTRLHDDHDKLGSTLVLAVLGQQHPDSLTPEVIAKVAEHLVALVKDDSQGGATRVAAVELLGKGFSLWRPYIHDIDSLIQKLFSLTLGEKALHNVAHNSLMLIGASEPKNFVISLGQYILEVHYSTHESLTGKPLNVSQHSAAIKTLGALIKKDPKSLLPLLPRLVETIVRSLDPHVPYLRDSCLEATTKVLHALVNKYPMVSFHQESQRLAVGTSDKVIVIYDLKTATRWHVLEGHKGPVTAINFAKSGKMLVSYSLSGEELKIWQTTSTFLGILGSTPHCIKTIGIPKVEEQIIEQVNLLETVHLKWGANNNTVNLLRSWEGTTTFKFENS